MASLEELRKEAEQRVADSDGTEPHHRKCWNCDPIKGYLKDYDFVFACFCCKRIFYKGEDLQIGEETLSS